MTKKQKEKLVKARESLKKKIQKVICKHTRKGEYFLGYGFLWVVARFEKFGGARVKFIGGYAALSDWLSCEAEIKQKFPEIESLWVNAD